MLPQAVGAVIPPVLYVDRGSSSCSDAGSGTIDQPYCTIGAAARIVNAGQTVQVAAGTYPEAVTVLTSGTSTAPIVFTAAAGATVTLSGQANGFLISGKSWITVSGFNVTKTSDRGIYVSSSSHVTISNNHVSFSGQPLSGKTKSGVYLTNVADSLVSGNTVDHNSDSGIHLTGGSTRNEIRGNLTFANAQGYQRAATGIRLYSSPGNTVDRNVTHDNEDSGIECYTGSNNTLLYDNVAYNNGDHGIDNYISTGQRIVANTVYKNVTAGINVEENSTGATIANNISGDNGVNSPRTHGDIRVDSTSTAGTAMNYDLVFLTSADTLLIWNSTSYASLSTFRSATGQEAHGIQADPKWTNRAGGDLHLTAGSAAIDSANSGASGQPSVDADGNDRYDDPATPNTGTGPRSYDDRGAYEFRPQTPADAAPTASLAVSPASGAAPLTVAADASGSTDDDATPIATYTFDFGDGSIVGPQAEAIAAHSYGTVGNFTVTVTVTDTAGLASTATARVAVEAPAGDSKPAAALNVSPNSGTPPLAVTADASGSTDSASTPIATYRFDLGDGAVAGNFTVTVAVTDTIGLTSTTSATVTVQIDSPPAASLIVNPTNGRAPLTVTADASGSTDNDPTPIATYTFDFGDGTVVGPQSAATTTHTYTKKGSFTATVTVKDTGGLASTATRHVKVR